MKRKKYIVSILIIVISIIFNNIAYAADDSCKLLLNVGKSEVEPGMTVDVTLRVSDINAGTGVVMISGLVEYDETAFEKIEYTACTNWQKTVTENYINMNTESLEATKEDQDVLKLTLTTKGTIKDGTYKVSLKKIEVTTDTDAFTLGDIEANVNIKKQSKDDSQDGNKDNDQNGNKDDNQNGNKDNDQNGDKDDNQNDGKEENPNGGIDQSQSGNKSENLEDNKNDNKVINEKDITLSDTSIPKAGLNTYLKIIIAVAVIIGIVCYTKYKEYSSIK